VIITNVSGTHDLGTAKFADAVWKFADTVWKAVCSEKLTTAA
jgi:hypothetical protein